MDQEIKTYLVESKSDDYGACIREIVETTKENASEYVYHKLLPADDIVVLRKYLPFIEYDEERERTNEERFYGA